MFPGAGLFSLVLLVGLIGRRAQVRGGISL